MRKIKRVAIKKSVLTKKKIFKEAVSINVKKTCKVLRILMMTSR